MTRRRVIAAAGVLALSAGAFTFCGGVDVPASPTSEAQSDSPPSPAPTSTLDPPPDAEVEADAGALLAAWAAALQPMLKADGGPSTTALWVSPRDGGSSANPFEVLLRHVASSDAGRRAGRPGDSPEPDAGPPACDPGPLKIALRKNTIDLIVAIDTSGSMFDTLPQVNDWLTQKLEPSLSSGGIDSQLMVLVDLDSLASTVRFAERRVDRSKEVWAPSDAGFAISGEVQSTDALDVLVEAAGQGNGSWLSRLRPDAAVHVLVVTDDRPRPLAVARFVQRLTSLARGRLGTEAEPKFTFHALLGMETSAEAWVLTADRPVVGETKRGCGMNPGTDYQGLSQRLGGLRGSVCHPESMNALVDAMLAPFRMAITCDTQLPPNFPADGPITMRAVDRRGRSLPLTKAFDTYNCETSAGGFLVSNHQVRVCPRSCELLTTDGYDAIEATGRCP